MKAARIGSSTTCCICMEDDLAPGSMFWLDCHHEYCRGCLRQHVTTAVKDDKMLPRRAVGADSNGHLPCICALP